MARSRVHEPRAAGWCVVVVVEDWIGSVSAVQRLVGVSTVLHTADQNDLVTFNDLVDDVIVDMPSEMPWSTAGWESIT